MNETLIIVALVFASMLAGLSYGAGFILKNRKKPLDKTYFSKKWQEAQVLCANKETWPLAIINADKLLDDALKKRHYKGKSMGERLAAAQRDISDNDGVWYGHKLRNRLVHESDVKLTQANVRNALLGIRQALRDLGAL
jgi:hypothetical protein